MHFRFLFLFFYFISLVSCSSGSSSDPTDSEPQHEQQKPGAGEPVQGFINGQKWIFRSGRAYFKKPQSRFVIVQLWSEDIPNPCHEKVGSVLQMRLTAPRAIDSWTITPEDPFNANLSIFFADLDFVPQPRDNMRADRGEIQFYSIDKEQVRGYVSGSFQNPRMGGTRVRGDFSVPFCP